MTPRTIVESIFSAGVAAVAPGRLVRDAINCLPSFIRRDIDAAPRILVVGAGKATAAMAEALEECFPDRLIGLVNVPEDVKEVTRSIRLHAARPVGWNHPTQAGVDGAREMLKLLSHSGPSDVSICLISGGGSALLPCPPASVPLADKQQITKQLHTSGATIEEMNCVRKHLSAVKGGRLGEAFAGKRLISLILSDVVGDRLDVIGSGPTVPDPTTYADAVGILERYRITPPVTIRDHLFRGQNGEITETPKLLPESIHTIVIGSNTTALNAAKFKAEEFGYSVLDLGPFIEGETNVVARVVADIVRSIRERSQPIAAPVCILLGGETTVTLGQNSGKGGRNQEFVLAMLHRLGLDGMNGVTILSGGTDGEDGPTDAAGAVGTRDTLMTAVQSRLNALDFLNRHDGYAFFELCGGLLKTGLTGTNVMDIRIILVDKISITTV